MKVKIIRKVDIKMDEEEFTILIHALQSHAERGNVNWPGEAEKAEEMRQAILDADRIDYRH